MERTAGTESRRTSTLTRGCSVTMSSSCSKSTWCVKVRTRTAVKTFQQQTLETFSSCDSKHSVLTTLSASCLLLRELPHRRCGLSGVLEGVPRNRYRSWTSHQEKTKTKQNLVFDFTRGSIVGRITEATSYAEMSVLTKQNHMWTV